MPGKIQRPIKPGAKPGGSGFRPPVITQKPATTSSHTQSMPRPGGSLIDRATDLSRIRGNMLKREAAREVANQMSQVPRPVVRPLAPPQKILPARPVMNRPMAPRPVVLPDRPGAAGAALKPGAPRQAPQFQPPAGGASIAASIPALGSLNTAGAHPQISMEVAALQASLSELESRSSFSEIQANLNEIDQNLNHVLKLLEGARAKGYVYQGDLEEVAYQVVDGWQAAREQALRMVQEQAPAFQSQLAPLGNQIQRLNASLGNPTAAMSLLGATKTQVSALLSRVNEIHYQVQRTYGDIRAELQRLSSRLTQIHWALDQLSAACFKLSQGENLVMAVSARWDKEGNDDPEGVLYLTNRRLVFEQKEKVATKKVLFLTMASELVQKALIDQALANVIEVKAQNKGLFGHQDFIEVRFADKSLNQVSFHLNGQDSTQWASWVQEAKSGRLEASQTSGSGLSFADLTGPVTSADLMTLQKEVNDLQEAITLKGVRQELADLENELSSLERKLAGLRARGYLIEKNLEADIKILSVQWERIRANASTSLEAQAKILGEQAAQLQQAMAQLAGMSGNLAAAKPAFIQAKSLLASLEAQANASESAVVALYVAYSDEIEALSAHLDWVEWMLEALTTASFKLLATESGVAAVEAQFARPGMEPENGILFLTDQRLLWEDRVDTFELKFEARVEQILDVQKVTDEITGIESLLFSLGAGATYPTAQFELSLPVGDDWLKMVGRARTGGYAQDSVGIDPAELERIRNAPKQCSNCGAVFSTPIFRGQLEIACEYCGVVSRL